MAFTSFGVIRNNIVSSKLGDSKLSGHGKKGSHGMNLPLKLRVMNVALEGVSGAPQANTVLVRDTEVRKKHVAWESIRQERWEGELEVQGQIPLWLVCNSSLSLSVF
ncbi:hypothetical protein AMTR_s00056p00057850 [Amborella trichopoda]|uniref:Uncharacterized protein n=1 Tax=Amborella trichopoda TaxID=13333 RepID=U5CY60_AMBTC|nr:hypothetical protein AMTR_s00056p00057850 [Amborella trichopoda]